MNARSPHNAAGLLGVLRQVAQQEDLNFLLTNRIPRGLLTRFMGWFSKIEQPQVRDLSIAVWKAFADLELDDARKAEFTSLHDLFIRELRQGARPVDPDPNIVTSPCDAIVGACGKLDGETAIQAKGFTYGLGDLLHDPGLVERHRDGRYVTLRLTSSMYHRFHAPAEAHVERVTYISGDTYNTNPIALGRVERLFCKNERAVIETRLARGDHRVTLVAVAAILIASIRLSFLDVMLHLDHRGPNVMSCDVPVSKGEEMGWFQHGSTIIVLAPDGFKLCRGIARGHVIRMGEPLLHLP